MAHNSSEDMWLEACAKEFVRGMKMQLEQALLGGTPPEGIQFLSTTRAKSSARHGSRAADTNPVPDYLKGRAVDVRNFLTRPGQLEWPPCEPRHLSIPHVDGKAPVLGHQDGNGRMGAFQFGLTLHLPPSKAVPAASRVALSYFLKENVPNVTEQLASLAQPPKSSPGSNAPSRPESNLAKRSSSKSLEEQMSSLLGNTTNSSPSLVTQTNTLKEPYRYRLLKNGEIRLFEITQSFTGHSHKPPDIRLSLRMHTAKLVHMKEKYTAISYVWGDATKTCGIDVSSTNWDGEVVKGNLQITHSLLHALRQAHATSMGTGWPRLFWADAVCINQAADEGPFLQEREEQVKIMHQIYSSASQVIVDLGPEDEHTATLMEMLQELDDGYARHADTNCRLEKRDLSGWNINAIHNEEDYLEAGIPLPQDKKWTAWAKLLARPWFRRIWVAQEYVAARSGTMIVGDEQMPLEYLAEHLLRVCGMGLGEGTRPRGKNYTDAEQSAAIAASSNMILLHNWRTQRRETGSIPAVGALSMSHNFEMTLQVDRMYALLSMCDFSGDSVPYVSYRQSVVDVYRRFNRYIIERSADDALALLSAGAASPDGPSWSPLWSKELWDSTPVPLTFTRDLDRYEWRDGVYQGPPPVVFPTPWTDRHRYAFRAGGEQKVPFHFSRDGKVLLVQGALCVSAFVRHVGPVFEGAPTGADLDQHIEAWGRDERCARAWLKKLWNDEAANKSSSHSNRLQLRYKTMPNLRRAYARTIIAATEEEYAMREHQDYLDGAWSAVNQHRLFERFGVLGRLDRKTLEGLQSFVGLDDGLCGVNDSVVWDAFFLHGPSRTKFRRLCVMSNGALALCPRYTGMLDIVGLFLGAQVPYILRMMPGGHQLIGEAYVHGMMSGEALRSRDWICKPMMLRIV